MVCAAWASRRRRRAWTSAPTASASASAAPARSRTTASSTTTDRSPASPLLTSPHRLSLPFSPSDWFLIAALMHASSLRRAIAASAFLFARKAFSKDDVVGCFLDLDAKTIHFSKNGAQFPKAFDVPPDVLRSGLFAAVCLKVRGSLFAILCKDHSAHFSITFCIER